MPTTDVRSLWKYSSHVIGKYNLLYLIFYWINTHKCFSEQCTNMHSLIFITAPKDIVYYSHFTDEETEAQKFNYLPSSAVLEKDLNRGCTALRGPHSHSPSKGLLVSVKTVLWPVLKHANSIRCPPFPTGNIRHASLLSAQQAINLSRPRFHNLCTIDILEKFFVTGLSCVLKRCLWAASWPLWCH